MNKSSENSQPFKWGKGEKLQMPLPVMMRPDIPNLMGSIAQRQKFRLPVVKLPNDLMSLAIPKITGRPAI